MTLEELTAYAEQFLKETYGMELGIPIEINGRLRRAQGRYISSYDDNEPKRIELAKFLINYGTDSVIKDTLKHELVHYAFHVQGLPFDDGDKVFEDELRRLGIRSSGTDLVGKRYLIRCNKCGRIGETDVKRVKNNPEFFASKCCDASLTYVGDAIYDGESRKELMNV